MFCEGFGFVSTPWQQERAQVKASCGYVLLPNFMFTTDSNLDSPNEAVAQQLGDHEAEGPKGATGGLILFYRKRIAVKLHGL